MSQKFENFGKYVLLEKLATGGMAEVHLARSTGANGIGKFFAVKRILPQFSENPEFIEMFKDEAKIVSNLQHSNIVSLYEFGVERSTFFIVIEYLDGRNLRQILNKMKKQGLMLSTEQVLYIIREVAAGLDHAHRCLDKQTGKPLNIIHRDMSPQNIMVSFEGECKIIDFGIAKAETQIETTRAGTLKGKFGYMSPEQAEGQNLDVRTDVFSLGIVLWELLANDRLFVANNEVNTLRKIRDCQIPSLRKINPNINPELERIVMKSLAKDRNFRYQTAAAFQRDINKFMNRSYPDFSPHDFSLFIKNLFQQEILESRRKQIEYARVDSNNPDQTVASMAPEKTILLENDLKANDATSTDNEDDNVDFGNKKTKNPNSATATAVALQKQVGERLKRGTVTPPPPPSSPSRSPSRSPKKDAGFKPDRSFGESTAPLRIERTDVFGNPYPVNGSMSGATNSRLNQYYFRQRRSFSSWLTTIMLVLLIGSGIASVLWYQANPRQATATVARLLSEAGILSQRTLTSERGGDKDSQLTHSTRINIKTTPGGAEILLDGKPTGDVTPATVMVQEGQPVVVSLRYRGQVVYRETLTPPKGGMFIEKSVRPQGYLDIVVFGSGEIFINNQSITKTPPARGVPVPADQEVVVRVYDPETKTADEERVSVPAGETRTVELRPKAGYRRPSK